MSTRVPTLTLLPLVILCLAGCQPQSPAALSDADRTTLRQDDEAFVKAMNAKDFATPASMYTEEASILPPNGEAVQGRQRIQKWLSDFPPISDFKLDIVDVDGRGDLAYVRGNYSMTVTPPGAAPAPDRGKYVEIWRKQGDGSWKIRWDIFNSDLAPGK